jgi:pyrroloquinoline quinone biosynthesis protein D
MQTPYASMAAAGKWLEFAAGSLEAPAERARENAQVNETAATPTIAPDARPRLPRGVRLVHNEAQCGWVLLAPERVFKADQIAAEIVKRCTGEATFGAIVEDLATTFNAPLERVRTDAAALLRGLADKKLLDL